MSTKQQRINPKHSLFANHYIATLNRIEAARLAGYKGDDASLAVQASRLLQNANVLRVINERLKESAIPANEVLMRLGEIARADIGDVIDDKGNLDLAKARVLRRTGVIKRVKQRTITTEQSDIFETEVEMYDAQAALNTFMKHYGLLVDKVKVEDWRSQAIEDIKAGKITYDALRQTFDDSLAKELFSLAGVPVTNDTPILSE